MPLYEYKCNICQETTEFIQKVNDAPKTDCGKCGAEGSMVRLISPPALQFKGTGWYLTDYSDKGKKAKAEAQKESSAAQASESKPSKDDK